MSAAPKITNIKKENLTDQIYNTLKEMILTGQWTVGERIPSENELADRFGVCRMSVRMALQRLQAIGLIDVRVGDGTFVKELSLGGYISEIGQFILRNKGLPEIAQFRRVFELEALRLAIEKYTPEQLATLSELLSQMMDAVRQNDNEGFIAADFRFHRFIGTMSGNSIFETLYDISSALMVDYYRANRKASPIRSESDLADEDHVRLFEAIANRDFERAREIYIDLIDYPLEEREETERN